MEQAYIEWVISGKKQNLTGQPQMLSVAAKTGNGIRASDCRAFPKHSYHKKSPHSAGFLQKYSSAVLATESP